MEERTKRLHPLKMLLDVFQFIKNTFFIFIILFVANFGTDKLYMKVFQVLFVVVIFWSFFSIVITWFQYRYVIKENAIHLSSGLFTKSYRTIPLWKIQNIQRRTSLLHKLFNITSLTLETGESGDQSSIAFPAISKREADWLEQIVHEKEEPLVEEIVDNVEWNEEEKRVSKEKKLHFKASKKELFKASFTSLSFLAVIPFVASIYFNIDDLFSLDDMTREVFKVTLRYWWLIVLVLIMIIIVSIAFGIFSTYWKYGKYEILSDKEKIYIKKGLIEEAAFSIQKQKVQAIQVIQSPIKRILRLAEVKLISAGDVGEEDLEINSLYPFLPINKAYKIINELLPDYFIEKHMEKLPKKALTFRMLRPSFFWIFVTIAIFYFKASLWYVSALLLFIIYLFRVLNYRNSRYLINDGFVQVKTGSLETSLFVTKRSKVVEIEVRRTKWQKYFGLATIDFVNRSNPVVHTKMKDLSLEKADEFYTWYTKRVRDIQTE